MRPVSGAGSRGVVVRQGQRAVGDRRFVQGRRPIPGGEHGGIDLGAVGARRQGARRIAEQRDDRQRGSAQPSAEVHRIEHPHVGTPDPGVRSSGSNGTFWPRWAEVTNALDQDGPAKTMSLGSSP